MIKAELRSENTFCFTINASIFNERVLTKALYWYAESFIIYWNKNKDNLFEITLELKPSANKIYTFEYVTHKFNQDLTYIIHSGFISGYQNRYGDNLKPPTNVYHRMTA